jgi:tetratricopeptide (TPR) repeat protein
MIILALEKEWMEETNKLLELIQSELRNRNLHLSLSNAFLDAVNSGLVSGKLSQIYLGHALEHINVCIEIDGSQAETWVEKGKILLMLFRAAEARDAFANAIKLKPEMNGVHFWKAEAHYYLREFDQSKLECSIMMQTGLYPSKIKENVEFWGANEKYKS